MKRIRITRKENTNNLNIKILTDLVEFSAYDLAFDKSYVIPSKNVFDNRIINLYDINLNEIIISEEAIKLLSQSDNDVFQHKTKSGIIFLKNEINITIKDFYYKKLGDLSKNKNINICVKEGDYGFLDFGIFQKIINKQRFKQTVGNF